MACANSGCADCAHCLTELAQHATVDGVVGDVSSLAELTGVTRLRGITSVISSSPLRAVASIVGKRSVGCASGVTAVNVTCGGVS